MTQPLKEGKTIDVYFEKKHNWINDVSVWAWVWRWWFGSWRAQHAVLEAAHQDLARGKHAILSRASLHTSCSAPTLPAASGRQPCHTSKLCLPLISPPHPHAPPPRVHRGTSTRTSGGTATSSPTRRRASSPLTSASATSSPTSSAPGSGGSSCRCACMAAGRARVRACACRPAVAVAVPVPACLLLKSIKNMPCVRTCPL